MHDNNIIIEAVRRANEDITEEINTAEGYELTDNRFDIFERDEEGNITGVKDEDDLTDEAHELITDELDSANYNEVLDVTNEYRHDYGDGILMALNEENINDLLDGWSAWDILNNLYDEVSTSDDYIYIDNLSNIRTTSDEWEGVDISDVTDWILRGNDYEARSVGAIGDIIDELAEAVEAAQAVTEALEELEQEAQREEASKGNEEAQREQERERSRHLRHLVLVLAAQAQEIYATPEEAAEYAAGGVTIDRDKAERLKAAIMEIYGGYGNENEEV